MERLHPPYTRIDIDLLVIFRYKVDDRHIALRNGVAEEWTLTLIAPVGGATPRPKPWSLRHLSLQQWHAQRLGSCWGHTASNAETRGAR